MRHALPFLFAHFLLGASTAATYQARYAAVDLAPSALRGRHLSLIVWATPSAPSSGRVRRPDRHAARPARHPDPGGPVCRRGTALRRRGAALSSVAAARPCRPGARRAGGAPGWRASAERCRSPGSGPDRRRRAGRPGRRDYHGAGPRGDGRSDDDDAGAHPRRGSRRGAGRLDVVGLVLSARVAGMFALAPVFGWLTDRLGRRR